MEHLPWLLLKFYSFFASLCFNQKNSKSSRSCFTEHHRTTASEIRMCDLRTNASEIRMCDLRTTASEIRRVSFFRTFFVSLDRSILFHRRCLMSKFSGILVLACRKIFTAFSNEPFSKLFPPYVRVSLFSHHLVFYDMKYETFVQS